MDALSVHTEREAGHDWLGGKGGSRMARLGGAGSGCVPVGMGAQPPEGRAPSRRQALRRLLEPEGYPTFDVLTRLIDRPGPLLSDFGDARMGFFMPPGTVARWIGTGVRGVGLGTWILVPYPGRASGGVRRLIPPDGSGTLTDATLLELATVGAAGPGWRQRS